MDNVYTWEGTGWYASRGEYFHGSYTNTRKVSMDGWEDHEVSQAARQQGYGTPRWYDSENALKEALGLD